MVPTSNPKITPLTRPQKYHGLHDGCQHVDRRDSTMPRRLRLYSTTMSFNSNLKVLYHVQVGKYIDMASCTIAALDWLITLDLEVSFIWNAEWTVPKAVFLVNRYLPIVDSLLAYFREHNYRHILIGPGFAFFLSVIACQVSMGSTPMLVCHFTKPLAVGVYLIALYIAEYTLAMRVCAVWGFNKKLMVALGLVYIGTFAFTAYNYFHTTIPSLHFVRIIPLDGCVSALPEGQKLYANYIILAIYDTAMLILMMYPTIKLRLLAKGQIPMISNFIISVYTEGIIFYAYLLLLSAVSIIVEFQVVSIQTNQK
ncbi:hypothetical protein D9756_009761 [Leucocoprinus leucothites]|uniref:DUF6533 domain-containing protein n=1 Tax=Leucocoprinus leucothites TaxID=201217 RepID=A0A8H5FTN8_9AGAR|nr:hypothetical protein D9756_009761 [Leucoagaricus leucothites]